MNKPVPVVVRVDSRVQSVVLLVSLVSSVLVLCFLYLLYFLVRAIGPSRKSARPGALATPRCASHVGPYV